MHSSEIAGFSSIASHSITVGKHMHTLMPYLNYSVKRKCFLLRFSIDHPALLQVGEHKPKTSFFLSKIFRWNDAFSFI